MGLQGVYMGWGQAQSASTARLALGVRSYAWRATSPGACACALFVCLRLRVLCRRCGSGSRRTRHTTRRSP